MSKGRKKKSLHDLGRDENILDSDHELLHKEIIDGSDRSAAIIAASMLEIALRKAVNSHFRPLTEDEYRKIFYDESAPLGSLGSLSRVSYALGISDLENYKRLNSIRKIRNAFAHSIKPILFSNEIVKKEMSVFPKQAKVSKEKIEELGFDFSKVSHEKSLYLATCFLMAIALEDYAVSKREN